jgi:hypothetical protein
VEKAFGSSNKVKGGKMRELIYSIIFLIIIILNLIYLDTLNKMTKQLAILETTQNQIILMMAGGCEPVDLTYLEKIKRNFELKEKKQ